MNIDKEILEVLKFNLYKACLESFGVKRQFIELEFSNSKFEEIKFFIDCQIYTLEVETEKLISNLKHLEKDTFEIIYFLKANLKHLIYCDFDSKGNFRIDFENNYSLVFDTNVADYANLSITFREKENSKKLKAVNILPNGVIESNIFYS